MEAQGGEEVYLLLIHDLGTRWGEWSASRSVRALPLGKGPPVPIGQEAGWVPEPVWTQRLEEKPLASAGGWTPIARSSSPQPDTILTELPRLLYTDRSLYIPELSSTPLHELNTISIDDKLPEIPAGYLLCQNKTKTC
jgi:hypothetical protein